MGNAVLLHFLCGVLAVFSASLVNADDPYRYYTWTVTYGTVKLLDVPQQVILINGQFPGPRLDVVTNDNIILNLFNKLDQPFLLTWNGIKQRKNSWQDGVLGTNCPIPPNSNYTYKFQTKDQIGKVAYVLQGNGVVGIVLPEKEEKVVALKKGDAIALPFGVVTWWYNKEDTELVVLLLGDTSKAHKTGEFTDFFLTGSHGIFTGFSAEFVSRAWDVDEDAVRSLVGNQKAEGIVKLDESFEMPEPKEEHRDGFVYNCEEAPLDVDIKDGGKVVVLNTKNLPLVAEVGLGADLVKLDGGAMCSPGFSCDSALQVTYIVSGGGRVQIVGVDGQRVLETTVKAGHLFIVPRFFVVSKICDPDGMSWFSIITTPNPVFTHLAGRTSVWKALSPQVLEASFKVSPDVEQLFRSKRMNEEIFFPPPK